MKTNWWKSGSPSPTSLSSGRRSMLRRSGSSSSRNRHQRLIPHSFDDDRIKKNRRVIDQFIRRTSMVGAGKCLNEDGLVYFAFANKFIVVVEVPRDHADSCFIYTMVCNISPNDHCNSEIIKAAMELNYMQFATRGATLGLDREEVNLCYSCPILGLSLAQFEAALRDFLITAVQTNKQLEAVKERCREVAEEGRE